jgi:hypothetical protein
VQQEKQKQHIRDVAKYGSQGFGNPLSIAAIILPLLQRFLQPLDF